MSDNLARWPATPLSEMRFGDPVEINVGSAEDFWRAIVASPTRLGFALSSEHAEYIEARTQPEPLKAWGAVDRLLEPFTAMVRAKVDIACCHILKGDVFEVTKDLADGAFRLRGTPFRAGRDHFFDWDAVDEQLEMIEEIVPPPGELPPGYGYERVECGWIFFRMQRDPGLHFPKVYAGRHEAIAGAWEDALKRGEVSINQCRTAQGLDPLVDQRVPPKPVGDSVTYWVVYGPAGGDGYTAIKQTMTGDTWNSTDEVIRSPALSIIRAKVAAWFREREIACVVVPRAEDDLIDVVETWL